VTDLSGPEGVITRSVGSNRGEARPGPRPTLGRRLTAAASGGVWAAELINYDIHRYSPLGDLLMTIRRRPEWFSSTSEWTGGTPDSPPNSSIDGVFEDASGRVWVFARKARDRWQEAWPKDFPVGREVPYSQGPNDVALWQTVIEVLDTTTRHLIASRTIDGLVMHVLGSQKAAMYEEDENGVPSIRIVSFTVTGPGGRDN